MTDPTPAPSLDTATELDTTADATVTAESLIEEVSIDGMCGVY